MNRLSTCAWIDTSSAATASSQTRNSGFTASARAMPMRAALAARELVRDSAAAATGSRPTRCEHVGDVVALRSRARRGRARRGASPTMSAHAHARIERGVGVLEDHLHREPVAALRLGAGSARDLAALRTAPRPRSARAARRRCGRASTCRSRTRRPGRPPRPCRSRGRRRRPRARSRRARSRRGARAMLRRRASSGLHEALATRRAARGAARRLASSRLVSAWIGWQQRTLRRSPSWSSGGSARQALGRARAARRGRRSPRGRSQQRRRHAGDLRAAARRAGCGRAPSRAGPRV